MAPIVAEGRIGILVMKKELPERTIGRF